MFTKETKVDDIGANRTWGSNLNVIWILAGIFSAGGMIIHSSALFNHFELTPDFSNFYQATYLIAHGHYYPYDTLFPFNYPHYGFPFLHSHGEFFVWLLAPLVAMFPNGFVLLVLQDLAIASTQVLAALWIHKLFQNKHAFVELLTIGAFIFLNPWYYFSAFFDFHLEPFSMLFLLAAAYTYLNGHRRLSLLFVLLVISTGDVPSTYLIGLGLGMFLLKPSKNISALLIALSGSVASVVESSLHLAEASSFLQRYGYLAGNHPPKSAISLVLGTLSHLGIIFSTLHQHIPLTVPYLISGNIVGLFSPLGLVTALIVLAAPVLVETPIFLSNFASFQIVSFEPILTVAGVMVLLWSYGNPNHLKSLLPKMAFAVSLVVALYTSYPNLIAAKDFNNSVSQSTATTLASVLKHIPSGAEVISGNGTVGRFSGRRLVYSLITFQGASVPIWSHQTYIIVVDNQGIADPSSAQAKVIRTFLLNDRSQVKEILSKGVVQIYRLTSKTTGYNLQFPPNA